MSDERPSDAEVEMVAVQIQSHLDDQGSYACIDDDAPDVVRRLLAHTKELEQQDETRYWSKMYVHDIPILRERAEEAEKERDEQKANYLGACSTVEAMHRAATGRFGEAPRRGVVEDVEDLRTERDQLRAQLAAAEKRHLHYKTTAERHIVELEAMVRESGRTLDTTDAKEPGNER